MRKLITFFLFLSITLIYGQNIQMVIVPSGSFTMGCTSEQNDCDSDESPTHQVTLSAYEIGKYEVTQKQWRDVMGTNPSHFSGDNRPVENLQWIDAVNFCNALSIRSGFTPVYSINGSTVTADWSANGYRLPTEAEWEYAARGGSQSTNTIYSGSNDLNSVAWQLGNAEGVTHDVGTLLPNQIGIYDMSGNVYEWCWDWYSETHYTANPQIDPTGPNSGTYHSLRGGSWLYGQASQCRVANRGSIDGPSLRIDYGFRVARTFIPTPSTGANWKMQINTTVQNLYDQLNHAGVDSLATEGYDPALDTPNPPTPPGNYIDAYFYHPEWNSPLGAKFASDVKQSTDLTDTVKRWFFEVESNVTNQDVTLTFVGIDIPSNFGKYLTDMQTGERVNLKNTNTYTYFNTSTSPRKFQLIIGDSTAPAISDLIPKGDEIWRSNTQKQISWTMSDGTGIDSVFLFVSNDNGTLFNPLVSLGNINNYNWDVFQEYLNNGYRVKVEVRDSLGNMSDITSPLAFTVVGDSLATTSPIGWSLFSIPLEPFNVAKSSIFDDDITNNPYFIWGYSFADGYTLASDINFGTGYWLGLIAQAEWDVTGTAVEADTIAQPLGLGYNILGTRYVRPVKKDDLRFIKEGQYLNFNEATTAGWITNAIYGYSGGGYNSVDQLDLFSGYWLAALVNGVQMVQRPATTLPATPPSLNPLSMTAENWNIDFTVETETLRDRSLFLGVSETATIGFDNQFDAPRPPTPPAGDYLEIYSEVTGSNYPQFLGNKYAIDYKPLEAAAWNLKVKKGSTTNQLVTIKWNKSQLATLPDTIAVKLKDMTTGQQIDMKVDSAYSFTYNGERNFAVNTSLTDIGSESEVPTEFVLNQNYPNPFNPSTTVRYSIPRESRVVLTLFNSLGEAVSVVRDEVLNAGWYQSEIKADDLPSGIYFMRLEATSSNDKFAQTIKMILLK